MNTRVDEPALAELNEPIESIDERWLQHRMKALKDFIKNVTVIDDRPITSATPVNEIAAPDDDGLGKIIATTIEEPSPTTKADDFHIDGPSHTLNIKELSDSFADIGVACAFVLPDSTESDAEKIMNRVVRASRLSDMVIIDWHLRNANSNLTTKILTELSKLDRQENGRLRLICVYTGQEVNQGILNDAIAALKSGGIDLQQSKKPGGFIARSDTCLLTVLSKDISATELPEILLKSFAELSDGILPTFALAAVGAIRKNAHHMVTRFGGELDSAYVANRMITDPPGDVSEMLRELFISECDNALGLESVSDNYLNNDVLMTWLDTRDLPITPLKYTANENEHNIDKCALINLVKFGVNEGSILNSVGKSFRPLPTKKRHLVSEYLATTRQKAHRSERKFARLVALRREAFGGAKLCNDENAWKPHLTTGTILELVPDKDDDKPKWLLCLTPICDTVRLKENKQFTFLIASETEGKKSNLILQVESGKDKKMYFDTKQPHFVTIAFCPDKSTGRVCGNKRTNSEATLPIFELFDSNQKKYTWLGEMRYARATKIIGELIGNWGRLGINDSEFLRLVEKGDFSIETD